MGRLGVFGSACDPITIGHLVTMDMVIDRRNLDGMILVPSSNKRRDKMRTLTSNEHRLNMINLAIADHDKIQVNTIEMNAEGWEIYTYETMKKLKIKIQKILFIFLQKISIIFLFLVS
jgi:nicotinate-nucleotide adenylyltransferase